MRDIERLLKAMKIKALKEKKVCKRMHNILDRVCLRTTSKPLNEGMDRRQVEQMLSATLDYVNSLNEEAKLIFLLGKCYGNSEALHEIIYGD